FVCGVGVAEGDVVEGDGALNITNRWPRSATPGVAGKREEFEQVAEEEAVTVKLAGVFEQRAHQALALIEGGVDQGEFAERNQTLRGFPNHPAESGAHYYESDQACCKFREALSSC